MYLLIYAVKYMLLFIQTICALIDSNTLIPPVRPKFYVENGDLHVFPSEYIIDHQTGWKISSLHFQFSQDPVSL